MEFDDEDDENVVIADADSGSSGGVVDETTRPAPNMNERRQHWPCPRHRPRQCIWGAQCTHSTMTRFFYGSGAFICSSCARPGPFGWLFRCTQDREDMIEHYYRLGFRVSFDPLGDELAQVAATAPPRRRSCAAREDPLSFLSEITTEQFLTYRPDQVARILRQRVEAQNVAEEHQRALRSAEPPPPPGMGFLAHTTNRAASSPNGMRSGPSVRMPRQGGSGADSKPWVMDDSEECQYKVCLSCRPSCVERSFLSLNAIVNDDIVPTAASGFGFHALGQRPITDAAVVRNIGRRGQLADEVGANEPSLVGTASSTAAANVSPPGETVDSAGRAQRSMWATFSLGDLISRIAGHESREEGCVRDMRLHTRAPWTPPPTPSKQGLKVAEASQLSFMVGLGTRPSITDGRSPASLKTNACVRRTVLASVPGPDGQAHIQQSDLFPNDTATRLGPEAPPEKIPYMSEESYDVGLTLPLGQAVAKLATQTALPPPSAEEDRFFSSPERMSEMMERENAEGSFGGSPLAVESGVAVLEESVEQGIADVVTRV